MFQTAKNYLIRLYKRIKKATEICIDFFVRHPLLRCIILAFTVLIFSEALCRHSVFEAFEFLYSSPVPFLYNYLIILCTLSAALFFPKKGFALTVISAVWLILSFVNCLVLLFRVTPFSAIDFSIAINMLGIIDIYLNVFQLILIILGSGAFITLLIFIWKKNPVSKINLKKHIAFFLSVIVITAITGTAAINSGALSRKFPSLAQAYKDYGFVYCFTLSIFDVGISQPPEYTVDTVESILEEIKNDIDKAPKEKPNIIVVQLESFFGINRVTNLVTAKDPVPNFTYLKKNCPHGLITVPSIGGGTANTEFEILTGMNLDHFGPGEYPYKTVLQTKTCECPAFTLKEYGYTPFAIHNHTSTFYDRHLVYSALGFDTFIPLEMMHGVEYTDLGWAKDAILTEQITDCLNSTESRDFIFTVSVQAHGKYPDEKLPSEDEIEIDLKNNSDAEKEAQYKYYVEQLNQTDAFVGKLIAYLSEYEEPTAVLFYGDHFPTIYLEEDMLTEGTKYQTDWAIWANYDIECENKNLASYQLMAHFLNALGSNLGTTTKLHQAADNIDNYQQKLEMLEYDMLYGDMITFGGDTPYHNTSMEIGIFDIYATDILYEDNCLYISGNRFNQYTKIKLNNRIKDTFFIDENCVMVEKVHLESGDTLQLVQLSPDRVELRTSAQYEIDSFLPNQDETPETSPEATDSPLAPAAFEETQVNN